MIRARDISSGKKHRNNSCNVDLQVTGPYKPRQEMIVQKTAKRLFYAAKYGNVQMGKILQPDLAGKPVMKSQLVNKIQARKYLEVGQDHPVKRQIRDRHASGDITSHYPRARTPVPIAANRAKKQGLFRTPSSISMVLSHKSNVSGRQKKEKEATSKITEASRPAPKDSAKHHMKMRKYINPPAKNRDVSPRFGTSAVRFGPVVF